MDAGLFGLEQCVETMPILLTNLQQCFLYFMRIQSSDNLSTVISVHIVMETK